ncbi:TPA: hypothetical protein ACSCYS_004310 [Aeromonas veronii]
MDSSFILAGLHGHQCCSGSLEQNITGARLMGVTALNLMMFASVGVSAVTVFGVVVASGLLLIFNKLTSSYEV